jgi:hypothetical protein
MKRFLRFAAAAMAFAHFIYAAEPASPAISADQLASRMDAARLGNTAIRARLEVRSSAGAKRDLQLQIKERRTKNAIDIVYRVLWPNEHKNEAVILHQKAGEAPSGSLVLLPNTVRALKPAQMSDGLFDSDLAYQDAVENFFAWEKQAIIGSEIVDRVNCQILESKPGKPGISIYAKVRSWIDPQRLVPLRVEKYSANGELVRRIDTTRVARDARHNPIAANLIVHGPRKDSVTELDGVRIDQDVNLTDADFTVAGFPH